MIFNELKLPKFKRQVRHGTPELMPYSHLVGNGITMLKDGSLTRSYRMYGTDLKMAGSDLTLAVKHQTNQALVRLADGWMMQSDLTRYYATEYEGGEPLPDPVSQLIENQRRRHYQRQGTHLETALTMTLTYRPPSEAEDRARRLFIIDPAPDDQRNLRHFVETTDTFAHDLSNYLTLEPMDSDDALSFYESCVIGEQVQVRSPKVPNYLDTIVGRHRLVVSRRPTIGGRALRMVIPSGFPLEAYPEIMDFLYRLPFPCRYTVRAILLGIQNAGRVITGIRKQHIQKKRRKWDFLIETTGRQSSPEYLNQHAVDMADDATFAAAEAESNQVREVYLSCGMTITDPDPRLADEKAEYVRAQFAYNRFPAWIETFNTVEVWRGFLPGDGFSNRRKPVVNTMNLADLTVTWQPWTGHRYNPNPMYPPKTPALFFATLDGLTPFRFHLHVGDAGQGDVGNGIVPGPIGAGKSTLANFMNAQFGKIPRSQVFVFDKGLASFVFTKAAGGEHWNLGNQRINAAPLINVDQPVERAWAHGYVSTLLRMALHRELAPLEDEALWTALELLAGRPRRFRTMTALQGLLQDDTLKDALTRYTLKGPMRQYLDADHDELLSGRLITFELATIQNSEALVPVLLYLFHRIDQRLDGRPTLIILDEAAWVLLAENEQGREAFAKELDRWLRDLRKVNGALWLLTQSLDDVRRSKLRNTILQGCPSRIFCPDAEAQTPNLAEVYRDFGLNDPQIATITVEMQQKRHYLLVSTDGCQKLDLELDPVTLAFAGAGSKENLRRVRELIERHGEGRWQPAWLRERGLPDAAAELETLMAEREPELAAAE